MRQASHILVWVFVSLAAVLALAAFPERAVPNDHDYASQAAITRWVVQRVPWGVEIIQNVGPLGFLVYPRLYSGELAWTKLLTNVALVLGILYAAAANNRLKPAVALVSVAVLALFAYNDAKYYLLAFILFAEPKDEDIRRRYVAIRVTAFAVLSLAKSTYLVAIGAYYILRIVGEHWLRLRPRRGLGEAAVYAAIAFSLWLSLGQHPSSIPSFFYAFLAFSSGYSQTLLIYESALLTILGLTLVGLLSIQVVVQMLTVEGGRLRVELAVVPSAVARLAIIFVVWKHAFVRADAGHVLVLAYFAICAALVMWVERPGFARATGRALKGAHVAVLAAAVVVVSVALQSQTISLPRHFLGRVGEIGRDLKFALSPSTHLASLDRALQASEHEIRVEAFDSRIDGATFSYFGYKPAITLFTRGLFVPTYSTISFAGWNNFVTQRDVLKAEAKGPKYFLVDVESIDYLYPGQNSPLLLRYIVDNYRLVALAGGVLLYERTEGGPSVDRSLFYDSAALESHFAGEFVFNRAGEHEIVFVNLESGLLDQLLALLYKHPEYTIEKRFSDGSVRKYKTTAGHLQMGISNYYVFRSNEELLASSTGLGPPTRVLSFALACRDLLGTCSTKGRYYTKRVGAPSYLARSSGQVTRGISVTLPVLKGTMSIDSPSLPRAVGDYYLFHAPITAEFDVPAGSRLLQIAHTMLETSYSHGGRSHGVMLRVLGVGGDGQSTTLIERTFDPFAKKTDRTEMTTQAELPAHVRRIVLSVRAVAAPGQDHFAIREVTFR